MQPIALITGKLMLAMLRCVFKDFTAFAHKQTTSHGPLLGWFNSKQTTQMFLASNQPFQPHTQSSQQELKRPTLKHKFGWCIQSNEWDTWRSKPWMNALPPYSFPPSTASGKKRSMTTRSTYSHKPFANGLITSFQNTAEWDHSTSNRISLKWRHSGTLIPV